MQCALLLDMRASSDRLELVDRVAPVPGVGVAVA
jgi:hypothetical protein